MASSYLNFLKIFLSFPTLGQQYYKNENIRLNSWKHRSYLLIFLLELEKFGLAIPKMLQNSKNGGFCEEFHSKNDFEAVLINFGCYGYGANVSEAVQKISTRTLLELCQLTKTGNFIATPMKKQNQQFITSLLEIRPWFLFFS